MNEVKNLTVQIPLELHGRVCAEKDKTGQTLSQYITALITDYYKNGGKSMENSRTMAFQVPEELFQRIKAHLARETARTGVKLSQREFVLGLIEDALNKAETGEA